MFEYERERERSKICAGKLQHSTQAHTSIRHRSAIYLTHWSLFDVQFQEHIALYDYFHWISKPQSRGATLKGREIKIAQVKRDFA